MNDTLFNILCSMAASFIFLFVVLFVFRPWISVAPFICKNTSEFSGENTMYFFKIVNKSLFTAYEIKVELMILEIRPTPPTGMTNIRMLPLSLVYDTHSNLPGYRPKWIRKEADHCLRFRTREDLSSIISDEFKSVRVQIIAKHGLTGLVKVFTQEFSDEQQIKQGKFSYGTKFGVI